MRQNQNIYKIFSRLFFIAFVHKSMINSRRLPLLEQRFFRDCRNWKRHEKLMSIQIHVPLEPMVRRSSHSVELTWDFSCRVFLDIFKDQYAQMEHAVHPKFILSRYEFEFLFKYKPISSFQVHVIGHQWEGRHYCHRNWYNCRQIGLWLAQGKTKNKNCNSRVLNASLDCDCESIFVVTFHEVRK